MSIPNAPIILFDGVCNLCSASVTFIMDRDPDAIFKFAPLESDVDLQLLDQFGVDRARTDSIVLVEDGACFIRSTAALRIARRLDGLWPLLYGFTVLPEAIRDGLYDYIAANRYQWFGKKETCRLPTPQDRDRFLAFSVPSTPTPS